MAKKAFLITYSIKSRVVVDSDKPEEQQLIEANEQVVSKVASETNGYITLDNVTEFEEDTEMPYEAEEE